MPHKPTRAPRAHIRQDSHLSRGLPPPAQDVDWDNDATTSFRRTLDDPNWASDDVSWSGNLSSLLEPDAFPEWNRDLEAPGPGRGALPPTAASDSAFRQSLVSSPPASLDEPRLAVEGSLARSMRPQRSRWLRSLYFIVPMFVVLGAGAYWNPRGDLLAIDDAPWWPLTPPPRSLARGLPVSEVTPTVVEPEPAIRPEPAVELEPSAELATGAALPAPDPEELSALAAFDEATATLTEDFAPKVQKSKARERKVSRAAARRRQREAQRARQTAFARPIMPMPDAIPDDATASVAAANQGVLQINSRPWARVVVDGKFVGHTPQRGLKLAPGTHRIVLENEPLDMSKTFEVVITSGKTITRVVMLEDNATADRTSHRD